jgi:hypothetical protein
MAHLTKQKAFHPIPLHTCSTPLHTPSSPLHTPSTPQDFTEIFGPQIGEQMIHLTKGGTESLAFRFADTYINMLPSMPDQRS